jgi:hypothetical protein
MKYDIQKYLDQAKAFRPFQYSFDVDHCIRDLRSS